MEAFWRKSNNFLHQLLSLVCLVSDECGSNSYRNHASWVMSWLVAWFVLVALVRFGMEQASGPAIFRVFGGHSVCMLLHLVDSVCSLYLVYLSLKDLIHLV